MTNSENALNPTHDELISASDALLTTTYHVVTTDPSVTTLTATYRSPEDRHPYYARLMNHASIGTALLLWSHEGPVTVLEVTESWEPTPETWSAWTHGMDGITLP